MINIVTSISLDSIEDCLLWDNYVEAHPYASPYHRTAWLQSIQSAYGFKVFGWMCKSETGEVTGILPSVWIQFAVLGKTLTSKFSSLPYCDIGGALADSSEIEQELIGQLTQFATQSGVSEVEHRVSVTKPKNIEQPVNDENEKRGPAEMQYEKVRMVMPLPETAEELFSSFKSKLRSQIRKAEKNGLTATVGRDSKHLDGFYQVYCRNMRDLGSPAHSKAWFENILTNYGEQIVVGNVWKDDVVIGAGIVLLNDKRCAIPWASTNSDYNRLAPNMLLYWSLLEHVTDRGAIEFDFGRSTPGEGTYKFKKQWGAEPIGLNWQSIVNGVVSSTDDKAEADEESRKSNLRAKVENIWQKLPVPLATNIGSRVRKYISL